MLKLAMATNTNADNMLLNACKFDGVPCNNLGSRRRALEDALPGNRRFLQQGADASTGLLEMSVTVPLEDTIKPQSVVSGLSDPAAVIGVVKVGPVSFKPSKVNMTVEVARVDAPPSGSFPTHPGLPPTDGPSPTAPADSKSAGAASSTFTPQSSVFIIVIACVSALVLGLVVTGAVLVVRKRARAPVASRADSELVVHTMEVRPRF